LQKSSFIVPKSYEDVVPMYAGQEIGWSIKDIDV